MKLARKSYFGEEVMKVSTVSSLPREKLKEIKVGCMKCIVLTTKWSLSHYGRSVLFL